MPEKPSITINSAYADQLNQEGAELEAIEAQMRAESEGRHELSPNSTTTETHVTDGSDKGRTQRIDGSGKEIPPEEKEEKEELEAQAEVEKEHEGKEDKPKVRPWSELRKTRKRNAELETALRNEVERVNNLEHEFKAFKAKLAPATEDKAPEIPEFNKDPFANLDKRSELVASRVAELNQDLQIEKLKNAINEDERSFAMANPNYVEARDYLVTREMDRARSVFRNFPEQQREAYAASVVNQRRAILIATARETGQSVAQLAYDLAVADGYKPKSDEVKSSPEVARQKVAEAKEREAQAKASLGSVGRTAPAKKALSRDDILNMDEKEMDKFSAENENWMNEVA